MLEGDAGIVGISRSPMNSLAAISSSSWFELDSEFEDDSEFQRSPGLVAKMALRSKISNFGMKTSLDQGKDY
ncbi:hypothetical protein L3X38_004381 [Prunus dulcis]|uniref:Uncharacterized protein n=1 Tax=Prunus dulcis TaxID=3755 RepID=A0AAD4ZNS8_PRUDU|nr:hypothetical protein L3X38_004381 [Prunus dulcis]